MKNKSTLMVILFGMSISLTGVIIIYHISRNSNRNRPGKETSKPQEPMENVNENAKYDPQSSFKSYKDATNIRIKEEDLVKNPKELEELLEKTAKYVRPALTFGFVPDIDWERRVIDRFLAGCFVHTKLTTVYFDELLDLVFGDNDLLKQDTTMLDHFQFVNRRIFIFFELTDTEEIRDMYRLNTPTSNILCWHVSDNYSEKFDDLAKKVINDFPTESKILEENIIPECSLNVVQLMINKVVRYMLDFAYGK